MTNPGDQQQPQIDPSLVLAKIEQRGELGAALVREAHFHVLAEHYAAELGKLRQEQGQDSDEDSSGGKASDKAT